MRNNYHHDWKGILLIGGLLLFGLLIFGWFISAGLTLIVTMIRGLGVLLGGLIKYTFSSIYNLVGVGLLCFLGYKGYQKYIRKRSKRDQVKYSDSDFERGEDQHYEWR